MSTFAPGTLGDPEDDGSAFEAPGTSDETQDDGSDDDGGFDPEQVKAENERLRNAHRQLLSEKTTFERTKAENEQLKSLLFEMNSRNRVEPAAPAEPEDDVDWDATFAELRRSDDPRDKVTLELSRELYRTKKQLTDLTQKSVAAKDIPAGDMAEVEALMKSGDYRTYQAAHKALLGQRYEDLKQKLDARKEGSEDPAKAAKPTRPAAAAPVSTTIRSVPRDKAAARKTVKASEYRELLKGPDASKWRQRRLSGGLDIVSG